MNQVEKEKGILKYRKTKLVKDNEIEVKIPDKLLIRLLKNELGQNKFYNKGFILDGFPENYEQAVMLFKQNKDLEAEEN